MRALIIAFSTYSRVPMPRVNFNEKAMRYCMCFFPIVGLFIGCVEAALYYLFHEVWELSFVFAALVLTAVPILITGGIHVDGYMDVADAKRSYKSREEQLAIMKDPHIGAFAVIDTICYFILYIGTSYQLLVSMGDGCYAKNVVPIVYIFVIERVLSGLSVVVFPKAKSDGMLATTAKTADKKVAAILVIMGIVFTAISAFVRPIHTAVVATIALIFFVAYWISSKQQYGGTTGDLAGDFLQKTEYACLIALLAVFEIL